MLVSVRLWLKRFNEKAVVELIRRRYMVTVYYNPLSPVFKPGYEASLTVSASFYEKNPPQKLAELIEERFREVLEVLRRYKATYTVRGVVVDFGLKKPGNADTLERVAREAVLRVFEAGEARETLVYEQ